MGNYYAGMINNTDGYGELYHHGIIGQKWGIRRYQNADGTLTAEGKKRYGVESVPTNSNKTIRKFVTGNLNGLPGIFSNKGLNSHREYRLKNKVESIKKNKNKYKSEKAYNKKLKRAEQKYNYQKERNINRELFDANMSTGKHFIANMLGTPGRVYRDTRSEGYGKAQSFIRSGINMVPYVNIAEQIQRHDKVTKQHGAKFRDWTWGY